MDGPGLFDEAEEEFEVVAEVTAPVVEARRTTAAPRAQTPDAPLALYRRYRPDTFAEVIGQEHVTVPLQRALANNKVGHAYLFSGPRGCGKTTSARILARCLNCEQGPTPTPCGECQSCRDLARGGPGSIDVIEIDAASHGGVDDARDLRERAYFAPVASRYKIYIIDEAHMVTTQGFNALLKLVEEPPPHTKFIFATTEPEKVIGTIRSRTHHYPFRLVPPRVLGDYLTHICEVEGVSIEHAAIPLVVRAGAGSVRDSLSVLDQLLGGAADTGVSYEQAAALLGYTPDVLLDEIVDAFAAGDSAGVFTTIDKVIEVGQDPRRFGEDLLRRLRDLVILAAVPEAVTTGILDVAEDQAQRLQTQVAGMGAGELTRAAEVIATGLTQMRGTTAPRLHLELMCSRVLLPGADDDERGLHARLDRLERRVGMMGEAPAAAAPAMPPAPAQQHPAPQQRPAERPAQQRPAEQPLQQRPAEQPAQERPAEQASDAQPAPAAEAPAPQPAAQQRPAGSAPAAPAQPVEPVQSTPTPPAPAAQTAPSSGQLTAAELRRVWPTVLDEVKRRRRFTHMLLAQHAQVLDVSDGVLTLGFSAAGPRENFGSGGSADVLADSMIEVMGVELHITTVVNDGSTPPDAPQQQRPAAAPPADQRVQPVDQRPQPERVHQADPAPVERHPSAEQRPAGAEVSGADPSTSSGNRGGGSGNRDGSGPSTSSRNRGGDSGPSTSSGNRGASSGPSTSSGNRESRNRENEVSAEDAVLDAEHNAEELLSTELGAEIIAVRDAD
ncbi:DNA polymerase III subunit gamma and tau [Tessaracoccus lacteus]|uniref:DNA polymerase III subunit gamma/tau n=1 Tax=Tessaracoccus lacteus TaxID=3041766 RepID=A0ABY8Q0Y7_9ACTN|nr:DNA polymerase III subunit gamma and tau [Tessaracoccus sp. T21]WGT48486.1 DNA polymerase III subunit gamma and tau [Tessaracoccus sp. T21]